MIKEALQYLFDQNSRRKIRLEKIGILDYTDDQLVPIIPPEYMKPIPLGFTSLSGFADFITEAQGRESDSVIEDFAWVRVKSYSTVYLSGVARPENFNHRFNWAECNLDLNPFDFSTWYPIENFIIALQSQFIPTANVEEIIDHLGNLANEHVVDNKDDGFSQTIQVRTGITTKSKVVIKNPVTLIPYRTFLEVDQPESICILRLREKDGIQCSLHIADGGKWRIDAVQNIGFWLQAKVGNFVKVLS